LGVSIDGPREYHDRIREFEGAFDKAVNGIKLLIETRKRRKVTHPHIRIASIIDPGNFGNSIFVIDLANELEVDGLAFGNLMFYTPRIKEKIAKFKDDTGLDISFVNAMELKEDHDFKLDRDGLKKFLDYTKESSRVSIRFDPPNPDYINLYTFKDPSPESRCLNPWTSVTIMPDGKVVPCQGLILGNIKQDKLRTLWNNEKIKNSAD